MSKLRKRIEQIKASREEMISSRWASINNTIAGFKTQVNAINEELKNTSYKPRRAELLAQRNKVLENAREFFDVEHTEQKKIYDGYKNQFKGILNIKEEDLSGIDLLSVDHSKHNTSFIKDLINVSSREQIEDIFEDACYAGEFEKARLIQVYAELKYNTKEDVDGNNRQDIVNRQAEQRANRNATSLDRVRRLVEAECRSISGITTGVYSFISSANELVNSIYNEADPWATQGLN